MTIERSNSGTVFTGAHIELFRLSALRAALRLKMSGIITRGRSPILVCQQDYKLKGRTAKALLPQVERLIEEWKKNHPKNTENGT